MSKRSALHVACVFGTRPEAIKMAPVIRALHGTAGVFRTTVMVTAQHRDMLDQVLDVFRIRPDIDLDLMRPNQTLEGLHARALEGCAKAFRRIQPDVVLVQGDTTTTLAAALAAFYQKTPIGHIEAGLRTFDAMNPFPEEINRTLVSVLAQWHFAATQTGKKNLLAEGVSPKRIFVTGNPVVDALAGVFDPGYNVREFGLGNGGEKGRIVLVTAHRRENFGEPLEQICQALNILAREFPEVRFVFPVHRNPMVRRTAARILKQTPSNLMRIQPLAYPQFINLLGRAALVLTDSGGIQEEAPALGVPAMILREKTERPEALKAGARLVPLEKDAIVRNVRAHLRKKKASHRKISCPFGDGKAAPRIVDILRWHYGFIPSKPRDFKDQN